MGFRISIRGGTNSSLNMIVSRNNELLINQWNILDTFVGIILCIGGALLVHVSIKMFSGCEFSIHYKSMVSFAILVLIISAGFSLMLTGLRLVMGPNGVRIENRTQQIVKWRRTIFLVKKSDVISFNKLKCVEIKCEIKKGHFASFCLFSVSINSETKQNILWEFSKKIQAESFAKEISTKTGLPISDKTTP